MKPLPSLPSLTIIIKPAMQRSTFATKHWWNDSDDADVVDDCNGRLVSALSQLGPPPRARDLGGKLQPRPDDALTALDWFWETDWWGRQECVYETLSLSPLSNVLHKYSNCLENVGFRASSFEGGSSIKGCRVCPIILCRHMCCLISLPFRFICVRCMPYKLQVLYRYLLHCSSAVHYAGFNQYTLW